MRVLVITSALPRSPADIAGGFVDQWCQVLVDAGHEVEALTWSDPQAEGRALFPTRYPVRRVPYAPPSRQTLFYGAGAPENLAARPLRALLVIPAMAAMMRAVLSTQPRPDLIVGHWAVPGGVLARLCGRLMGRPSLVVGHSGGVHLLASLPSALGRPIARLVCAGPTTAPTAALAAKLGAIGGATIEPLSMGFSAVEGDRRSRRAEVLCMGRLVPIKGFDLAIEAAAAAGLPLHVAGDGPERDRLEALAGRLGADVTFHGFVGGEAKEALLGRCSVGLMPSRITTSGRHEGLPVSLLEMMSAGVVPVVSDFPGAREVVPRPDLQVVGGADAQSWAAALAGVHREADELRAENEDAASRYTWAAISPRWVELVERAARR